MLLNVAIDESSDVARSSARLIRSLGDGQLVQQLIEHLDGFLVLALLSSGIRRCGVHDVDGGHVLLLMVERCEEGFVIRRRKVCG